MSTKSVPDASFTEETEKLLQSLALPPFEILGGFSSLHALIQQALKPSIPDTFEEISCKCHCKI